MLVAPNTDTRDASAVARFESSLAALSRAARTEDALQAAHDPATASSSPPPLTLSAIAAVQPLDAAEAPSTDNVIALPVRRPVDTVDAADELDLSTELRGSLYLLGALLGPVLAVAALVG
jgi:hypothetical protein